MQFFCAVLILSTFGDRSVLYRWQAGAIRNTQDQCISNSYTMGCPPVRGDNPRALASGLSYVQVDKHGLCDGVSSQVRTQAIIDELFTDYKPSQIPICLEENVTVSIDVALRQIMDMDEKEQRLSTNVWLRLRWKDCRLTWKPELHNNISHILVSYEDIWTPDITLYDSAADEEMYPIRDLFMGKVLNDGSVSYAFPSYLKSSCVVDVTFFPFDSQRCRLQFGSWSYDGLELDLVNYRDQGDISQFVDSMVWEVLEMSVERNVVVYSCCPEPYPDVSFYIVMKRRPTFYIVTMIFPCLLMSFISALVFLLPAESGEKVSLTITVLLSLAVYMLIIADMLPGASSNFPIIRIYFAIEMGIITISCVQSVLVLNLFYRGTTGRQVPRWVRTIVLDCVGKMLCVTSEKSRQSEKYVYRSHSKDERFSSSNGIVIATSNTVSESATPAERREDTLQTNTSDESSNQQHYLKSLDNHFKARDKEEDINWASTRENLSSGCCEQHRRRPACASAQSDQRLCYSRIEKYHI